MLLIQRATSPYKGWWSLPGGRVRFGESLRDAARRELLEETSISADIDREEIGLVELIEPASPEAAGFHFLVVAFRGRDPEGVAVAGDDAGAVAWVRREALSDYQLVPGTASIIEKSEA